MGNGAGLVKLVAWLAGIKNVIKYIYEHHGSVFDFAPRLWFSDSLGPTEYSQTREIVDTLKINVF